MESSQANEALLQEIAQRQRLIAELGQQTEREQLMSAIALLICSSLNLEEILNTTVIEVRQFLNCDRVVVYQVEAKTGVATVVAESTQPNYQSLINVKIHTPLFAERLGDYKQGNIRVLNDIQQQGSLTAINQLLQQQQVKAALIMPLLYGGKFWGLLAIHQCSGARQWQQLEIDLLQQLATQVSIAIQQSELYQQVVQLNTNLENQVQERTKQLQQSLEYEAILKRISDDVRDSLDENQILQVAVWELAVALNIDGCDSALYNISEATATICYEYTISLPTSQGKVMQMAGFQEGYNQLLQGQYFQFCQLVPGYRGTVAMLACPIFDDRGALGDLWLFKQQNCDFSDLEIRLVQQVANQCAIAMRQARLYQASMVQVEELEKLNNLKDDFLSTVSHELRTPLANMKMAIQMLGLTLNRSQELFAELRKPAKEQNKVARYYQILQNECERELTLIDDLLDLQQMYAGVQPLLLTSINLQTWLPEIAEAFSQRLKNQQQHLTIEVAPEVSNLVGDSASLGRVLTELLDNACKYTPPGEKIAIKAVSDGQIMQISVTNFGVEIPPSERERVFDRFYRIPNSDPWKQGGTGLGLALVKQILTRIKATITVADGDRGQTCFMVEVPLMPTL
ncbi:GAF domain-containing protein [Synechocystis sp. PCC 7509]|uniref:GAF domain-containing protein n=1 Tax=Synechocystis sp. PCC 7509 TaxID=927677 RepID=UPI0002ACD7A9|nr:GAF domain-containing protein [Synechocystis sp. PCC 7509]